MPICTRDGFEAKAQKTPEKFQDNEMVFYCETTKEIFRDYEEYFRHVMLINSTIWQCEETGRENLTYAEALYSEKKARKKIDSFKECLRAPTLLAIDKAQQATYKDIFNIVHNLIKDRFFLSEIVQAVITSAGSYHECKIIEIIKPTITSPNTQTQLSKTNVYDPAIIKYKLEKLSGVQAGENFIVPAQNIKRTRFEFGRDILQLFIKDSVHRVQGFIRPKPEVFKKYVTDKELEWQKIFIGDLPIWSPAKPRLIAPKREQKSKSKDLANGNKKDSTNNGNKKHIANGNKKDSKQSSISNYVVKDVDPVEKLKKEKSLKEQMERVRKEKEAKAAEIERKRLETLAKIDDEIKRINRKTDDLERVDQKLLPSFRPVQTYFPVKYFGDFMYIQEFLYTFAGMLSGIDAFNKNITFYEMSRAFTTTEVAGPLSDIITVLLSTIFSLQNEEEDECSIEYIKPKIGIIQEPWPTIRRATECHIYVRKHLSNKLHDLPLDPQTISEVLRLHLLASGANTDEKSDKWRYMYRNGYFITEDPGLLLRIQQPHILRSLNMYTIYQLPFSDKLKIINCLIAQILTYSSTINLVDERSENATKSKQKIRLMVIAENKRLHSLAAEKKKLQYDYHLKISEPEIKENAEKKKELYDEMQKQIELIDTKNIKEKKIFDNEMIDEQSNIFNFMIYLGMDRCYRKYYVFESLAGLFIEHPDECYDDICLNDPPKNWHNIINIPKNRKDLHTFFRKYFANLENSSTITKKSENDIEADKENLENLPNGKINSTTTLTNGDVKSTETTLLNGTTNTNTELIETTNDIKSSTTIPTQYQLYMCTGNSKDCIVHNSKNPDRVKWSFIHLDSELEELINSLNPLGDRESYLREQLITFKPLLLNHIKNCPINYILLDDDSKRRRPFEVQMNMETNRRYMNTNYGLTEHHDINDIMYSSCVEKILQLEVDITTGCLGKMKVNDLQKWRQNLLDNQYEPQIELVYGLDDAKSIDPGENLGNTIDIESEDSSDEGVISYDSPELHKNVEHLASALLQIEQSIEQKFFKAPFGLQKEIRDKADRLIQLAKATLKLKHWEISLMKSNSFSSIFLHLNILYDSIKWNRSTNRSCCIICRRRGEPEKMLLCDECNAGTHMFCLKPKLKKIPEGNWYCRRCVTLCGYSNNNVEQEKKNKRKRFLPQDESDVSSICSKDEDSDEYVPEKVIMQRKRDKKFKMQMNNDRRYINGTADDTEEDNEDVQNEPISEGELIFENDGSEEEELDGDDAVNGDEQEESETNKVVNNDSDEEDENNSYAESDEEDEEEETVEENDDDGVACNICSYNQCEIICGSCLLEFHLDCVNLKRVPRNTWKCTKCKTKEVKKRKIQDNFVSESSEDSEEQPLAKRSKRNATATTSKRNSSSTKRNSKSNAVEIDDSPKYNNNNRRSRRTGDNLPLNSILLYDLLDDVAKNSNSWPFLRPVLQSEVPDYYDIIKRPMDFAKIKSKLNMGQYRINEELLNDVQLVFKNCDTYNSEGNEIYKAGASLEKFVIKRCKELNLPFTPSDMNAS